MIANGLHAVAPGKVAMVVTHLEMRAPQLRDAPLPEGLEFVQIEPDITTYRDIFRRVGEDWLWHGRLVMPDHALVALLTDPEVHFYTLMKDGQAEAILELDFRTKGACELAYFGLSNALIGTGAGAYLMDRAVQLAFYAKVDRFHLHTCTIDSPQALSFYKRSGFEVTHQEIEIDDDPRLSGHLPETAAPHVPILRG